MLQLSETGMGKLPTYIAPEHSLEPWTILTTEPQAELRAFRWLSYRGVTCYLPLYRVKVRAGRNQSRDAVRPVFRGYLFTRPRAPDLSLWRDAVGVSGILRVGENIAHLSEQDIDTIREIEELLARDKKLRKVWDFKPGDRVRIGEDAGAWAGYDGVIQRLDKNGKTLVEVMSPSRTYPVALPAAWLKAM